MSSTVFTLFPQQTVDHFFRPAAIPWIALSAFFTAFYLYLFVFYKERRKKNRQRPKEQFWQTVGMVS
ncbi:hypothetical protein EAY64_04525 [Aquitalea palustris]|uniref:Uncharacterized protein n=1 Tax=Aquitalea palustris TaxID=2480983 RepID=A0A454JLW2_9NEIS|nr:hypothetical protein EAY64_04525 [Aquitalea palustris]